MFTRQILESIFLPMGRDFRSLALFKSMQPQSEKSNLVYCNYSVNTHPVRKQVYEALNDKPFIHFEHMGNHRSYNLSPKEFFERLSKSKFCICPRGNAIDTFRLWDCLYVGTIPIVVKEAVFHEAMTDLPILFLESYEQFNELTEEFLEEQYEAMLQQSYSFEKLTLNHWMPDEAAKLPTS